PRRGPRPGRRLPHRPHPIQPQRRPKMTTEPTKAPRHRRALLDRVAAAGVSALCLLYTAPAYASGSSMPWEEPLQAVLESIEGPVAKIIAVIIIIVTGLTLAFGDTGGGFRRLIQIVFG